MIRFAAGWGAPAKEARGADFVRVSAGTKAYAQGDTVEITLKSPYAGEAQVAVATDRLIDFKTLSVGENGTTVSLKTYGRLGRRGLCDGHGDPAARPGQLAQAASAPWA